MKDVFEDLATGDDPVRKAQEKSRRELPKRFYKDVTVAELDDLFAIHLDGRPIRTPGRRVVGVPHRPAAEAMAAEWAAQGTHINPATMPVTRLVHSAIDGVADAVEAVAEDAAKYAGTDLLCYRAEGPDGLVARQSEQWDPVVKWAEGRFGLTFRLAGGVMPVAQDENVIPAVLAAIPRDPFLLSATHQFTTITGSVLLALAIVEGRLGFEEAFAASNVDEDWNTEQWGTDAEAISRRAWRSDEIKAAAILTQR